MRPVFFPSGLPGYMTDVRHPSGATTALWSPYGQPGDTLWVRESLVRQDQSMGPSWPCYAADGATAPGEWRWKRATLPSIYLPRALSRITLRVTSVRIERLQEISEADARAEGAPIGEMMPAEINGKRGQVMIFDPRKAFAVLWDSINGAKAPWSLNPWVWVVAFERVK